MRVHVLHHALCFDGAASSALFTAFFERLRGPASFHYIAKEHCSGDPYVDADFAAEEVAGVDFRYSQDPRMTWYFDHHRSAFQLPGDHEHFAADRSGQKFHDPRARSCASYLAAIADQHFGVDLSDHAELIHWAEVIDSASFTDPAQPVRLEAPALRLMTFVESNREPALVEPFIRDLLRLPLATHAAAEYVVRALQPRLEEHQRDIALIKERLRVAGDVLEFQLLDGPGRTYNKFIPYYHHPEVRYVVGLIRAQGGRIKLTAGYNPWLPKAAREHDLAGILEPLGGGGHPFVAGCTFEATEEAAAVAAAELVAARLRGGAPATSRSQG